MFVWFTIVCFVISLGLWLALYGLFMVCFELFSIWRLFGCVLVIGCLFVYYIFAWMFAFVVACFCFALLTIFGVVFNVWFVLAGAGVGLVVWV